jgi:hypothetical protein
VQTILLDLTLRMSNITLKLMNPKGELTLTIKSALLASLADGWQVLKQVPPSCSPPSPWLLPASSGSCPLHPCPCILVLRCMQAWYCDTAALVCPHYYPTLLCFGASPLPDRCCSTHAMP